MSEYKSFEEGWREHNNKNLHKRLDKCRIRITKLTNRIKVLNKELQNKNVGHKGLIDRNMDLQNRLFYEERVNTQLKTEIKRLKRTLKNQSELKGKINTLNSKTTHKHSVNKSWSGLSFPLTLPNIFSRI